MSAAQDLYHSKHYIQALFFGHLAIEKLLKSRIIRVTKKEPLYSHDLVVLSSHAKLMLGVKDIDFLAKINVYYIRARYQDYKKSLYKQADREFTRKELTAIKRFFKRII